MWLEGLDPALAQLLNAAIRPLIPTAAVGGWGTVGAGDACEVDGGDVGNYLDVVGISELKG